MPGPPKEFLHPPTSIATYSYTDIAEGTGVTSFYCATTKDSSGTGYILTANTLYSNDLTSTASISQTGAYTRIFNQDFDLTAFNFPQTIKGTANINVSWGLQNQISGTVGLYLKFIIKKNGVEIANVQTETIDHNDDGVEFTSLLKVALAQTHFKKGDVLRVTLEAWSNGQAASSGGNVIILHDPKERTEDTWPSSALRVDVPFVIDL